MGQGSGGGDAKKRKLHRRGGLGSDPDAGDGFYYCHECLLMLFHSDLLGKPEVDLGSLVALELQSQ